MEGNNWANVNVGIPNPAEILDGKRSILTRFTNIILPIQELYQLNPTNVHIFCDFAGDIISFHHKKRIFLNLRHYEAWRRKSFHICVLNAHQGSNRWQPSDEWRLLWGLYLMVTDLSPDS